MLVPASHTVSIQTPNCYWRLAKQFVFIARTVWNTFTHCAVKKVEWSLSMPRRHIGGAEVQLHSFTASALDGGEW
jgi:hypothetical protein